MGAASARGEQAGTHPTAWARARHPLGSVHLEELSPGGYPLHPRALEIARSYPALRHSRGLGGGIEVWPLMNRGGGGD